MSEESATLTDAEIAEVAEHAKQYQAERQAREVLAEVARACFCFRCTEDFVM